MNENDRPNDGPRLPFQQGQQPPLASSSAPILSRAAVDEIPNRPLKDGGPAGDESKAVLDNARGTAGLIELYKELLKAPIPEEMLRLVRELETKERK
jgi:hypothetical protein